MFLFSVPVYITVVCEALFSSPAHFFPAQLCFAGKEDWKIDWILN